MGLSPSKINKYHILEWIAIFYFVLFSLIFNFNYSLPPKIQNLLNKLQIIFKDSYGIKFGGFWRSSIKAFVLDQSFREIKKTIINLICILQCRK